MSGDPLWYKDAIVYQLQVRGFADSDADGVGDFRGLTGKLDYLQDLGVTALWLLPFYPSPLRDDGYDIADYTSINSLYGTLADFKTFLREAHRRDLKVITEMVLNHTSDQHEWFQRARRAKPGSTLRDFYVWSDTWDRYTEARIIFKDFEPSNWTWDPLAKAYYWHRFYAHQPDLNFDNAAVRKAMFEVLDSWLEMGVDGLRLDAVPYLYEREGTNCENLPETHAFLKDLRRHLERQFSERMLLAEANQWPEDAAAYFGNGDECHMAFHFPVMPRLFMALHMEDRFPVVDIMQQTPTIPESAQWALFLRNHDELTLEMVTDEDRDYMYRAYAADPRARVNLGIRRRLAPLLGNDRRRIELMNALLFSLPGTPILYYGDEIGMGDNIYLGDRNGVRTPMQWSADRNAGFSRANPQRLYSPIIIDPEYHYEACNVEAQQNNLHSMLWWTKRLIALRKRLKAFGRGTIDFLHPENRKVLAFLRQYRDETILVVANLSRLVQFVELDLAAFKEMIPIEVFGRNPFPRIGELPYLLTLGPHSFYWFTLGAPRVSTVSQRALQLQATGDWTELLHDRHAQLRDALSNYLPGRRWFASKARKLTLVDVQDRVRLEFDGGAAEVVTLQCAYSEGQPEVYVLPLSYATGDRQHAVAEGFPQAVVAGVHVVQSEAAGAPAEDGVLYDALVDERFAKLLLALLAGRKRLRGDIGSLRAVRSRAFRALVPPVLQAPPPPTLLRTEQSNTSVAFGDRLMLKVFRKLEDGLNPEVEIQEFLTDRTTFAHASRIAAWLEYRRPDGRVATLAALSEYVPNEGDAWKYAVDAVGRYLQEVLASGARHHPPAPPSNPHPLNLLGQESPDPGSLLGPHRDWVRLLGTRTAELHVALASDPNDPEFAPEGFSAWYQRSLYQAARSYTRQALESLRSRQRDLPEDDRQLARQLLKREEELLAGLKAILSRKLTGKRIRCHGDYHLGQVLYTGKDFVIIDFEGEPARPLTERRYRRSPLRDVAGMLRSLEYAAAYALYVKVDRPMDVATLTPWAQSWALWMSVAFLASYLEGARPSGILPKSDAELRLLLDFLLMEKGVFELRYELNNRPNWVRLPLTGLLRLLDLAAVPV